MQALGQFQGHADEKTQLQTAQEASKALLGSVEQALQKTGVADAQRLYQAYQDVLLPTEQGKAQAALQTAAQREVITQIEAQGGHLRGIPKALWASLSPEGRKAAQTFAEKQALQVIHPAELRQHTERKLIELGITYKLPQAQSNALHLFLEEAVRAEQRRIKRTLTPGGEYKDFIDALIPQLIHHPKGWFWGEYSRLTIPADQKSTVNQMLKKEGIENPTESQQLQRYWRKIYESQGVPPDFRAQLKTKHPNLSEEQIQAIYQKAYQRHNP